MPGWLPPILKLIDFMHAFVRALPCVLIGSALMAFFGIVISLEAINAIFTALFIYAAAKVEKARENWIGA